MKLKAVKSVGRWETFLHTAGSKLSMRWRDSAAIKVQPTSLSRRSRFHTRGHKRVPAGRIAGIKGRKKRLHNLSLSIKGNHPNAKMHGSG
ncbi:hypothetical protein X975_09835, partial [Stegodyphus mimosarum]